MPLCHSLVSMTTLVTSRHSSTRLSGSDKGKNASLPLSRILRSIDLPLLVISVNWRLPTTALGHQQRRRLSIAAIIGIGEFRFLVIDVSTLVYQSLQLAACVPSPRGVCRSAMCCICSSNSSAARRFSSSASRC
jgi:hypothetical protein